MGVVVMLRKRQKVARSFSFPSVEATLTPEIVKDYKMGAALRRFGLDLARQMKEVRKKVIGVEFHGITFTMHYES